MISGWGLNENGKKFSKRDLAAKQVGVFNKYDPEDVIDKYGADALRFWAAGSHLGHDLRYHEEDVKTGRKLVLKLWNITRLVEQYAPDFDPRQIVPVADRTPEDRWIVSRLERLLPAVERGFETYDYAIAREALDHFFWTEFCDDYVELVKDRFWNAASYSDELRASARSTLWETLRTLLGLYAPFLPFVTEELFQEMYAAHESVPSLHVTAWPEAPAVPIAEVPEIETVRARPPGGPRRTHPHRPRSGPPAHRARRGRCRRRRRARSSSRCGRASRRRRAPARSASARPRSRRRSKASASTSSPSPSHQLFERLWPRAGRLCSAHAHGLQRLARKKPPGARSAAPGSRTTRPP